MAAPEGTPLHQLAALPLSGSSSSSPLLRLRSPASRDLPSPPAGSSSPPLAAPSWQEASSLSRRGADSRPAACAEEAPGRGDNEARLSEEGTRIDETKAQVAALLLKRQFRSVIRLVSELLQQPQLPPDLHIQWVAVKIYALLSRKDGAGIAAALRALPHPLSSPYWTYEFHGGLYAGKRGSLIPFCLHTFLACAPSVCTPNSPACLDAIYALLRFARRRLETYCHPSRCACPEPSERSPTAALRKSLLRVAAGRPPSSSAAVSSPPPASSARSPEGPLGADAAADDSLLHALWLERLTTAAFLAAEILVAKGHPQEALQLLQEEVLKRRQGQQHTPTLSLMGRIGLRMGSLDLADECFGYVECLSECDNVTAQTNSGLLALLSRDAGRARAAFGAGHELAELGEEERRKFLWGEKAAKFELNREEDVREGEHARQAASLPGWAPKRLAGVSYPSALASTASNLAVANLYDRKLYEATVVLESAMERQPDESLFVGGVRNLLTLYEFSFNKHTCLSYLSNLIHTAAAEDDELGALVTS
ncbi:hypothetical protein BESB_026310 [Besnoitia besnoiti]|uniref:Tetratricopeptide repeat-containing protein n=1 Tax=Besnoitia besnoiti TaxID=94643 RepID=A0A2A9M7N3_BESBE|nr:uncharacterized protein BESB_026310 [Besnoitia besnoiti]PFH31657.1 hypothetical protein BESB_026310 [Besnoitia besnoiti]